MINKYKHNINMMLYNVNSKCDLCKHSDYSEISDYTKFIV